MQSECKADVYVVMVSSNTNSPAQRAVRLAAYRTAPTQTHVQQQQSAAQYKCRLEHVVDQS
jgi:hypothetical protein